MGSSTMYDVRCTMYDVRCILIRKIIVLYKKYLHTHLYCMVMYSMQRVSIHLKIIFAKACVRYGL